ncbi:MAG: hypothetical protein ACRDVK_06545 [Acidimicrobiia bacterium]
MGGWSTALFISERIARIADLWDNLWWVHQRVAETAANHLPRGPVDEEVAAMKYVVDTLHSEMRKRGWAAN